MNPFPEFAIRIYFFYSSLMSVNRKSRTAAIHEKTRSWKKKQKVKNRAKFSILDKLNGKKRPKG